ncbi:hypothetical protein QJS66_12040 [Kocuria rhizophila]|nr:hypothetical protein QJS66_12040 [Kocuria rhizophila]
MNPDRAFPGRHPGDPGDQPTPRPAAAEGPGWRPGVIAVEHCVGHRAASVAATDCRLAAEGAPVSLWRDAWRQLRKAPPSSSQRAHRPGDRGGPLSAAVLDRALRGLSPLPAENSNGEPPRGTPCITTQAATCTRVIAGSRASLMVGLFTTVVVVVGGIIGALAGYFGGWLDAILARLGGILLRPA